MRRRAVVSLVLGRIGLRHSLSFGVNIYLNIGVRCRSEEIYLRCFELRSIGGLAVGKECGCADWVLRRVVVDLKMLEWLVKCCELVASVDGEDGVVRLGSVESGV